MSHLGSVVIESLDTSRGSATVKAVTATTSAACPSCDVISHRGHGRYVRRLADLTLASWPVVLELTVRRFLCTTATCERRTFVEQVDGLTTRFGRQTQPVRSLLLAIGHALAGRAGARLARTMAIPASPNTLLRLIRGHHRPPPARAPRILGVDDFALKRGHVYGTLLIDIETSRPIDVLADRTSATLAAWLRAHPGAEIICRDRASAYAEAARTAAPGAIQVADRFHLWHGLCQAVEKIVAAHRACLAPATTAGRQRVEHQSPPRATNVPPSLEGPLAGRTRDRHAAVHLMRRDGVTINVIAATLGLDRKTVRRYAAAETADDLLAEPRRDHGGRALHPYLAYLYQRWNAGCTDAARLHTELRERGYQGSERTLRRHLQPLRAAGLPAPPAPTAVTVRQATNWITRDPQTLAPEHQEALVQILDHCPALRDAKQSLGSFAAIMTNLRGHDLPAWLAQADATELAPLRSFARGLRHDLDAVTAGLTMTWNSGPVEGHVNRVKMLKRQMYGRAEFDLLRLRVLHS